MLATLIVALTFAPAKCIGFIGKTSGHASITRSGKIIPNLGAEHEWLPITLNDELNVQRGQVDLIVSGETIPIKGPRKLKIDKEVLRQIVVILETRGGLACQRPKGDALPPNDVSLLIPPSSRLYTGSRQEYPTIHWLEGSKVSRVSLRVTDTAGKTIWGPKLFPKNALMAESEPLYEELRAKTAPGAIVFFELRNEGSPSHKDRVRCQVSTALSAPPIPGFSSLAKDPAAMLRFLDQPDGYLHKKFHIELVDYLFNNRGERPKSLFVTSVTRTLAKRLSLDQWDHTMEDGFNWPLYDKWLAPEVIDL